jgi:hypothetical protein
MKKGELKNVQNQIISANTQISKKKYFELHAPIHEIPSTIQN